MPYAVCPECDEEVLVNRKVRIGQVIICDHCGTRLEVVDVDPIELDWAFDEPENYEDEEEDVLGYTSETLAFEDEEEEEEELFEEDLGLEFEDEDEE